ncbi:hypothetical protein TL16_g06560 [Triparma laevis f. inornata]|uniref:Deubiquitinating enzyme MINDY-3/4 conserved domain-containing protein n=2 Tax=Triparma laevis TaxID=1534972 RepID=A0A9W7CAS2_9STRA|nr:hypothetical protein TL16_g06560 [Triparma laevis f. inornata]GMI02310.1 hypothetical protein TrLO_g7408 [Triparma laevis f. longispina]
MADQLQAITGISTQEASMYMDMAGNNLETAVELFFSMSSGGAPPPPPTPPTSTLSPAAKILFDFPTYASLPEAWTNQPLIFNDTSSNFSLGLPQNKNGPCGILVSINALLLSQTLNLRPDANLTITPPPTPDEIYTLVSSILTRCDSSPKFVTLTTQNSLENYAVAPFPSTKTPDIAESLASPLGLLILLLSMIETRGVDKVKSESSMPNTPFEPLVSGPFNLCGTELINLAIFGKATPNVGAYNPDDDNKKVAFTPTPIGLISKSELSSVPVADHWKAPTHPIFIVHGGDHFTLLFKTTATNTPSPNTQYFAYNALPPNRLLCSLTLSGSSLTKPPPVTQNVHKPSHYKIQIGEVESIVQAHPSDKKARPDAWRRWRYELCIANEKMVSDDSASPERPNDATPQVKFELGPRPTNVPWRCVSCYSTRFSTMCFGQNQASDEVCSNCGKTKTAAGYTILKSYEELPPPLRRRIDRTENKLLSVIRTRWSDAEIKFGADATYTLGEADLSSLNVPCI